MSTTNLLNGFDMVAALSQNFLNSQLAAISQNPNSKPPPPHQKPSYAIADSFTLQLDPTATAGTPGAWNSVIVTQMSPPTVTIGANNTVVLTLHITAGTVQYIDMSAVQQTASLADTDISFTVNMSLADMPDADSLAAPQQTIDQLNTFQTSDFSIQFLALEFESASMISSCDVSSPNFTKGSRQYIVLLNCLNAYLQGNNPYILGYPIQTVNPAVTNPTLPAFAPTSCEFSTTVNANDAGLSTLNYCLMTNHDEFPTDASSGIFNTPWLTDDSEAGMLTISNDVFVNGYLIPLVLPQIKSAFFMPACPKSPYPQPPSSALVNNISDWTSTPAGWSLTLTQNNTANDSRGILVNAPGQPDYYQCIDNTITCNVSLSNENGNMTITATVDINFYTKVAMQEMQNTNWVEQNITQNFDLILTFTAGDNGTIIIKPMITPSPLPPPSGGTPTLGPSAKFGADLSSTLTSKFDSIGTNITAMVSQLTSDFAINIGNDMSFLNNQFVLPAASVFNYNGLAFNSEQDMQVSIANAA